MNGNRESRSWTINEDETIDGPGGVTIRLIDMEELAPTMDKIKMQLGCGQGLPDSPESDSFKALIETDLEFLTFAMCKVGNAVFRCLPALLDDATEEAWGWWKTALGTLASVCTETSAELGQQY